MTSRLFSYSVASPTVERPTDRRFVMASWAFLVAAVVISSSALLDYATLNVGTFAWSLALLTVATSAPVLSVRQRAPVLALVTPLAGSAWVLLLILATGGSGSGLALAFFIPITWSAINLAPWETFIVLAVLAVSELVVTIDPFNLSDAVRARRIGIYLLVGSLTAYAIHALRLRLARLDEQRSVTNELLHESVVALESRNREERELRRLMDQLHVCESREAGYDLIERTAPALFRSAGVVAVLDARSDRLTAVASWVAAPDDSLVSLPAN